MKKDFGIIVNYLNFLEFHDGFEVEEILKYFKDNFVIEHLKGVQKMRNTGYKNLKNKHLDFSNKFSEVLQKLRPELLEENIPAPEKKEPKVLPLYSTAYFYNKLGVSAAAYKKWKTKYKFKETGTPKKRLIREDDIERFLKDNEKYRAAWERKD